MPKRNHSGSSLKQLGLRSCESTGISWKSTTRKSQLNSHGKPKSPDKFEAHILWSWDRKSKKGSLRGGLWSLCLHLSSWPFSQISSWHFARVKSTPHSKSRWNMVERHGISLFANLKQHLTAYQTGGRLSCSLSCLKALRFSNLKTSKNEKSIEIYLPFTSSQNPRLPLHEGVACSTAHRNLPRRQRKIRSVVGTPLSQPWATKHPASAHERCENAFHTWTLRIRVALIWVASEKGKHYYDILWHYLCYMLLEL